MIEWWSVMNWRNEWKEVSIYQQKKRQLCMNYLLLYYKKNKIDKILVI
jgi:hypothetical protein